MRRISIPFLIAPIVAAVFLSYPLTAQLPSDPELVYVRVSAIDRERNRPLRGIFKENLKVFEDNKLQDITYFSDAEADRPLQVTVIWDIHANAQEDFKGRALSTMTKTGNSKDEFLVIEPGKTLLHEAVLQALNTLEQNGNDKKRALVLFTSKSSPSSYPLSKVRDRLKGLDIQLYVVNLQTSSGLSSDVDRQALRDLAELSGGDAFFPSSTSQMTDISRKILTRLKNQYLIGYRSTNRATDGKWRKFRITGEYFDSKRKKLVKFDVISKPGYYAPIR